jgi:hypothetical protein
VPSLNAGLGGMINPLKILRRRSSLVVADLPASSIALNMSNRHKATPAVFQEPDTNSLLDNFGF